MAALLAGCLFDTSGLTGGGPGPGAPDARPDPTAPDASAVMIDAAPGAPDARPGDPDANCAWPFVPAHFDPCAAGNPAPSQPINISVAGTWIYNTDDGTLTNPLDVQVVAPPSSDEGGVHTLWVQGIEIGDSSTLRVIGAQPLMIVSTGDISVNGMIDVSSVWDPVDKEYDRGAGSGPSECPQDPPFDGRACTPHGGSGGGGGGFGGAGGAGGVGANDRDCGPGNPDGIPGGEGGEALGSPPAQIRGGCDGRRGGRGETDDYGVGGAGGGAVHLASQTRIEVRGTIHAGGAGGAGAEDKRSGGGGGGSGGFIGLEAPTIALDGAVLAANGGGGGGGTDNGLAGTGVNGLASDEIANGGPATNNGGDGGDGSAAGELAGQPGLEADRGGGGGGGGAGFILVYQATPTVASPSIDSPPLEPM